MGKRRAASASATATGSVSSSSTRPSRMRAEQRPGLLQALRAWRRAPARRRRCRPPAARRRRAPTSPAAWSVGQQPDAVREVSCLLPGDGLAVAVCGEHRRGHVRGLPPRSGSPLSSQMSPPPRAAGRAWWAWAVQGVRRDPAAAIAWSAARPPATKPASSSFSLPWTLPTSGAPSSSRSRARSASKAISARTDAPAVGAARSASVTCESLHVLGGQVDAVAAEVLGDVLEVLDDLQGGADRVGAPDALGGGGAGDAEDEPADGVRGQLAVGQQVVVGP